MVGAALIRMLFSLDGKSFFDSILPRIGMLLFGSVMSFAMILLAVTFSFKVFDWGLSVGGF